jgi:hypothetical protein
MFYNTLNYNSDTENKNRTRYLKACAYIIQKFVKI